MCGILGDIFLFERNNFHNSLQLLEKRGPDQEGIKKIEYQRFNLNFGFKRLSILDLSDKGSQPMYSEDGRYVLIFNGEIYNFINLRKKLQLDGFRFESNCDSEVLLKSWQKWGKGCLKFLEGMYSFAIFDKREGLLYLARDPFGIKPLYYVFKDNLFSFSSSIDPLLKLHPDLKRYNREIVLRYLVEGQYDKGKFTFFEDIFRLEPGCLIELNLNEKYLYLTKNRWFEIEKKDSNSYDSKLDFHKSLTLTRDLFLNSVEEQLRSDVDLGFTLSGGIDSSSIVCAARYIDPKFKIKTFSYRSPDKSLDEFKWINEVNNFVKADSNTITLKQELLKDNINELIKTQNEPVQSMSFLAEFMIYKLAQENGIKVILDGHGSDELFAGYDGYPGYKIINLFKAKKYLRLLRFFQNYKNTNSNKTDIIHSIINAFIYNLNIPNFEKLLFFLKLSKNKYILNKKNFSYSINKNRFIDYKRTLLQNKLIDELTESSCPYQLRSADHSSMLRSIENRVPFLNKQLFEYVIKMPDEYLISDKGITKYIFREAMRGIVPDVILNRRDKIGFASGNSIFLDLDNKSYCDLISNFERFDFLNKKEISKTLFLNKTKSIDMHSLNWRIYNLLTWADTYDLV